MWSGVAKTVEDARSANISVGAQVTRGPDWRGGNSDGGKVRCKWGQCKAGSNTRSPTRRLPRVIFVFSGIPSPPPPLPIHVN